MEHNNLAAITKALRNAVDTGDLGGITDGVVALEQVATSQTVHVRSLRVNRYVIRRRAVVLDKEVWCTWVLECEDTITKDHLEAILEETYDFPDDVYKDGDARYTSQEVERARNWNEVIEGVPLIRMERSSNGYDLKYEGDVAEAQALPKTDKDALKEKVAALSADTLNELWNWLSTTNLISDSHGKHTTKELVTNIIDRGDADTLALASWLDEIEEKPEKTETKQDETSKTTESILADTDFLEELKQMSDKTGIQNGETS